LVGHDADQATHRRRSEQHALRAAQHFDTGDVEQLRVRLREAAQRTRLKRGLVKIDARRRRLDKADPADPSNNVLRIAEASGREGHARHGVRDAGEILCVETAKQVGRQGGDTCRDVLKCLRTLQGRDDDVAALS
jgi:hypothetical protein